MSQWLLQEEEEEEGCDVNEPLEHMSAGGGWPQKTLSYKPREEEKDWTGASAGNNACDSEVR